MHYVGVRSSLSGVQRRTPRSTTPPVTQTAKAIRGTGRQARDRGGHLAAAHQLVYCEPTTPRPERELLRSQNTNKTLRQKHRVIPAANWAVIFSWALACEALLCVRYFSHATAKIYNCIQRIVLFPPPLTRTLQINARKRNVSLLLLLLDRMKAFTCIIASDIDVNSLLRPRHFR